MSRKYHVTTTVNGDEYEYLCEPQQTLLDALRDELMPVSYTHLTLPTILRV